MEVSRQVYWSGLPCPSPGDLPDPGIKPGSPARQADSLPSEPPGKMVLNPFYPSIRIADLWGSLIVPTRVTRPACLVPVNNGMGDVARKWKTGRISELLHLWLSPLPGMLFT